jgi:dTMP kinase
MNKRRKIYCYQFSIEKQKIFKMTMEREAFVFYPWGKNKIKIISEQGIDQYYATVITKVFGCKDSYIVSKRINKNKVLYEHWETPGGKQDPEDNGNLWTTAKREMNEETQQSIDKWNNQEPLFTFIQKANHISPRTDSMTVFLKEITLQEFSLFENEKDKNSSWKIKKEHEIMLLSIIPSLKKYFLLKWNRNKLPQLIIFDGVDGCGKTTICSKIKEKLIEENFNVIQNTFKRKRQQSDDNQIGRFRKEVVQELNKRIISYDEHKTDIIITDKSPYSEYYYQKTKAFQRGDISPYENYLIEIEIFRYKEIIDNAIVIFLNNNQAWKNYIRRENLPEKYKSFPSMKKHEYKQMEESFLKNSHLLYKNFKEFKVKNDSYSWEPIYQHIKNGMARRT